ncbi:glycine-rich RNA-binding protein 3, mitochondrial [Drosophila mojavensis]|uniref:Tes101 n=3 Tax=mojavensis species complex TaxID=198037 RepID=B4KH93_DROMO|nr:glycine-rich RNA-binding protein 3, mitochondrial [Drosophila mojavensis]EDW13310.1 Tes101 [Drosophila mojavensis]
MDYGNSGAEFNWSYVGGQGGNGGQGMTYPQMGQMGQGSYGSGGGQQWLHSNQGYQNSVPNSTPPAPFEAYNQSMMRYTNVHKAGGGMGHMGMGGMGGSYGGYGSGMNRNGLGHAGGGMGQNANSGYSSW